MICPLIQNACFDLARLFIAYDILRNYRNVKACDELVDTVVYFGICMIRSAGKDDYFPALLTRSFDDIVSVIPDFLQIRLIFPISRCRCRLYFLQGYILIESEKLGMDFLRKILRSVYADKFVEEFDILYSSDIRMNYFGVVCDNGTVVMIVSQMLVKVI